MNTTKLQSAIKEYMRKKKENPLYYADHVAEREERRNYYQAFTNEKLLSVLEDDFYEYVSKLWSMLIWGNKQYIVGKLLSDNGFEKIKVESNGVIDEKSLRTWDSEDVLSVYDSLVRAHESINNLALVPECF